MIKENISEVENTVDICMISYNQKAFVTKAIQGVLNQTYRDFHLIICDDASVDGTKEICEEFQYEYPDKISFYAGEKNVGMMQNFLRCLTIATSKYIAICEGDDYWTDPEKLQRQIDMLEAQPEVVLSFHNADVINANGSETIRKFNKCSERTYEGEEILKHWLIPTASVVFRNVLENPLPEFFLKSTHGDLSLFLFLSKFGSFGYIDRTMSIYRLNAQSVTGSRFKGIKHNEKHISQCVLMIDYFNPRYKALLNARITEYLCSNAYLYAREKKTATGHEEPMAGYANELVREFKKY